MEKRSLGLVAGAGILILVAVLAFLLGRQSADPRPEPTPPPAAEQAPATHAQDGDQAVEAAQAEESAALRQWLVGGWAEVSTNCETDTGEQFNADGRYANYGEQGYWSVEGNQLTVRITHELRELDEEPYEQWVPLARPTSHTTSLIRESADRRVTIDGGERVRLMRCPLSSYTFTVPLEG